ncbi:MAG: hypothetical protein JSS04_14385 [Proteobacteria bacterium]|nr:hypothetical protein [Pseudomonadota bacterium]
MRALAAIVAVMLPLAAAAQEQPATAQRPKLRITGDYGWLTPEDRNSYCFWGGELYSIGAAFCSRQQTLTTCTEVAGRRPTWVNKENDKFCDRNSSLTPP